VQTLSNTGFLKRFPVQNCVVVIDSQQGELEAEEARIARLVG